MTETVKKTWRCVCGHSLADHSLIRRQRMVASAPFGYVQGACQVEGCKCERGRSEAGPEHDV